jgi:hypothetical protein
MAAIPPEDDQPPDGMTLDELRAHALEHGFVMDDAPSDLVLGGDEYPWEDVQASRRNRRLQAKHPVTEGKGKYLASAKACPNCDAPPEGLSWCYFQSPKETWPMLCGVAGWMAICDRCHVQVNFFSEVMS